MEQMIRFVLVNSGESRTSEPNILIILAGLRGLQWELFAQWLQSYVSAIGRKGFREFMVRATGVQPPFPFNVRSFAEVVKSGGGAVAGTNTEVGALMLQLATLNPKLDRVMRKLANLKLALCPDSPAGSGSGSGGSSINWEDNSDICRSHTSVNDFFL